MKLGVFLLPNPSQYLKHMIEKIIKALRNFYLEERLTNETGSLIKI